MGLGEPNDGEGLWDEITSLLGPELVWPADDEDVVEEAADAWRQAALAAGSARDGIVAAANASYVSWQDSAGRRYKASLDRLAGTLGRLHEEMTATADALLRYAGQIFEQKVKTTVEVLAAAAAFSSLAGSTSLPGILVRRMFARTVGQKIAASLAARAVGYLMPSGPGALADLEAELLELGVQVPSGMQLPAVAGRFAGDGSRAHWFGAPGVALDPDDGEYTLLSTVDDSVPAFTVDAEWLVCTAPPTPLAAEESSWAVPDDLATLLAEPAEPAEPAEATVPDEPPAGGSGADADLPERTGFVAPVANPPDADADAVPVTGDGAPVPPPVVDQDVLDRVAAADMAPSARHEADLSWTPPAKPPRHARTAKPAVARIADIEPLPAKPADRHVAVPDVAPEHPPAQDVAPDTAANESTSDGPGPAVDGATGTTADATGEGASSSAGTRGDSAGSGPAATRDPSSETATAPDTRATESGSGPAVAGTTAGAPRRIPWFPVRTPAAERPAGVESTSAEVRGTRHEMSPAATTGQTESRFEARTSAASPPDEVRAAGSADAGPAAGRDVGVSTSAEYTSDPAPASRPATTSGPADIRGADAQPTSAGSTANQVAAALPAAAPSARDAVRGAQPAAATGPAGVGAEEVRDADALPLAGDTVREAGPEVRTAPGATGSAGVGVEEVRGADALPVTEYGAPDRRQEPGPAGTAAPVGIGSAEAPVAAALPVAQTPVRDEAQPAAVPGPAGAGASPTAESTSDAVGAGSAEVPVVGAAPAADEVTSAAGRDAGHAARVAEAMPAPATLDAARDAGHDVRPPGSVGPAKNPDATELSVPSESTVDQSGPVALANSALHPGPADSGAGPDRVAATAEPTVDVRPGRGPDDAGPAELAATTVEPERVTPAPDATRSYSPEPVPDATRPDAARPPAPDVRGAATHPAPERTPDTHTPEPPGTPATGPPESTVDVGRVPVALGGVTVRFEVRPAEPAVEPGGAGRPESSDDRPGAVRRTPQDPAFVGRYDGRIADRADQEPAPPDGGWLPDFLRARTASWLPNTPAFAASAAPDTAASWPVRGRVYAGGRVTATPGAAAPAVFGLPTVAGLLGGRVGDALLAPVADRIAARRAMWRGAGPDGADWFPRLRATAGTYDNRLSGAIAGRLRRMQQLQLAAGRPAPQGWFSAKALRGFIAGTDSAIARAAGFLLQHDLPVPVAPGLTPLRVGSNLVLGAVADTLVGDTVPQTATPAERYAMEDQVFAELHLRMARAQDLLEQMDSQIGAAHGRVAAARARPADHPAPATGDAVDAEFDALRRALADVGAAMLAELRAGRQATLGPDGAPPAPTGPGYPAYVRAAARLLHAELAAADPRYGEQAVLLKDIVRAVDRVHRCGGGPNGSHRPYAAARAGLDVALRRAGARLARWIDVPPDPAAVRAPSLVDAAVRLPVRVGRPVPPGGAAPAQPRWPRLPVAGQWAPQQHPSFPPGSFPPGPPPLPALPQAHPALPPHGHPAAQWHIQRPAHCGHPAHPAYCGCPPPGAERPAYGPMHLPPGGPR